MSAAAATFLSLLPIVNPLGNLPLFLALTADESQKERMRTASATTRDMVLILTTFLFGGRFLLHFLGISLPVLRISGGLVVGHSAWQMVTGTERLGTEEHEEAVAKEDVSLTPLATPVLAGPGAIGVVIGLSAHVTAWTAYLGYVAGIVGVALATYFVWRLGQPLAHRLGRNGMGALNQIAGFLILAIAVELVAQGIRESGLLK